MAFVACPRCTHACGNIVDAERGITLECQYCGYVHPEPVICDKCNTPLQVGEWPFCPHGFPLAGLSVIDDELEGGPRHFETMGEDAPFISTKSEWRSEVEKRQLRSVGDRKPADYFARQRRMHMEELRDTGTNREY